MPWHNSRQRGDPWSQTPAQVEEAIARFKDRFKGGRFPGLWIILGILLIIWLISCFYTVGVQEVGLVQRFGKFVRLTKPGLHLKLPSGIEKVTKVEVQKVYSEDFGMRTIRPGIRTKYAPARAYLKESLMLTGDLNVAVVPWVVLFKIRDPFKYTFKVRKPRDTLRDLSEAIMRQVVGDRSIDEVISERRQIAEEVKVELQKALNEADTGIQVQTVELKTTTVPDPVKPSFNEVNQSIQEKEKIIYEAQAQYNKAIPAAKGQALKTVREAEGYALKRKNQALGDAARFLALYNEYVKAKDVTRRRIYLESIGDILPRVSHKYIIDEENKALLPLFDLTQKGAEK